MKKESKKEGVVEWFDNQRGYGFISVNDGQKKVEYFVHFSNILMDEGYKTLKPGQEVFFSTQSTPKGIQAVEVEPLD